MRIVPLELKDRRERIGIGGRSKAMKAWRLRGKKQENNPMKPSKPKHPARSNVEERLKKLEKLLKQLREDVATLKARTHRNTPIG